jgi:uncharacterized protein YbjQ (UPF0145 family)
MVCSLFIKQKKIYVNKQSYRKPDMKKVFILFILAQFWGCGYGNNIQTNITPIGHISYDEKTYDIEVYWENILPEDKDFQQLAFLEAEGPKNSSTEELLSKLKKQAMDIGADAIISIKQSYTERERGDLAADLITGKSSSEKFMAIKLTAVAIRYRHIHVPK